VCQGELRAQGLRLAVELKASHPLVLGDGARLQQVCWNLLQNAAKFTPAGGTVRVSSADLAGGGVAVAVADTGVGVAPELLPKLFDPFEQGGSETARRHGGLGLGLAICQAIIQAHGGRLVAASAGLGQGTTFTVELLGRPETDAEKAGTRTTPRAGSKDGPA
ncbi:MAG: hypothetical protein JO069_07830, partial [Verrucomicrobia bacterium]|nr:hypothetical protein [Verrucomicrobiota bacterium]